MRFPDVHVVMPRGDQAPKSDANVIIGDIAEVYVDGIQLVTLENVTVTTGPDSLGAVTVSIPISRISIKEPDSIPEGEAT